jgi:Flp pilus assembly protein TadB
VTDPRHESQAERDDRNLGELLQELRVAGLAVSAAVLLVTGFVVSGVPAVLISVFVACVIGLVWFAFPLARRAR